MEPFVNIFFAIDKDQNEFITTRELRDYVRENRLDEGMVTRWQTLFDPNNTGRITFSKFCDVLGIKPEQTRALHMRTQSAAPVGRDSDIKVIFENMPQSMQMQIIKEYKRLKSPPNQYDQKELTSILKRWLDNNYGRAWQVIIVQGSFWLTFSYTDDSSFQFSHNDESVLIWRTSMDN